jgi:hypothetical protein
MSEFDLDPSSLRDWMAAVGLLRIISETTEAGALRWRLVRGRYRLFLENAPDDLAIRCERWVEQHKSAWKFAGKDNVTFDAAFWRDYANSAAGIEAALWCAVASDGVWHRSGDKLQASGLEYAHGGGHQDWLGSLRYFLSNAVTAQDFARILSGQRDETMKGSICRWDPACERSHAYRAKAPTKDVMTQDQTINALAAIGMATFPSAPTEQGLVTPLILGRNVVRWPIWIDPIRTAELEAAVCCDWRWPTMRARRWLSGKLYCFSRGELREPEMSADLPGGSRSQKHSEVQGLAQV